MIFLVSARIILPHTVLPYGTDGKTKKDSQSRPYLLHMLLPYERELRADFVFYNFFGLFIFLQKYRKIISYIKLKIEAAWSLGL